MSKKALPFSTTKLPSMDDAREFAESLIENLPAILIIEDDAALNRLIRITLEREGFATTQVMNGADAMVAARKMPFAMILLDYLLPDLNAQQIIIALREEKIDSPVMVMTGLGDEKLAVEIMKLGACDYIVKESDFIVKLPKIVRQALEAVEKEIDLKRAERELRKSESKYRELYESMMDAYVKVDMAGRINEFNQVYCDMIGYTAEETRYLTYKDITPEKWNDLENRILENQIFKRGYSDVYEKEYRRKDGTIIPVELRTILLKDHSGNCIGMGAIVRDISERKQAEQRQKKLEEQLRQSQKLEAIGQLSSGVAHDFNNMLGAIMGHAELLKANLNPESQLLRHSEVIISSCLKAADLTKQLLSFARKAPFELQKIDMNAFVKQVARLMERTIDRRVEIIVEVPAQSAFISGDRNQLENALLNIAINARDAMPDGGCLTITSEIVAMDQAEIQDEHIEAMKGPYVRISIADTGTGMSKETKERIFEPFFTTKEIGKGTGLGLASVYGCVKQHNGHIIVESRVGVGTRFDLYFPIALSGPSVDQKQEAALRPGKGTLLVVDDEPIFHTILTDIFEPLGYTLHCCLNGIEAEEYYRVNNSAIDVVILDMNMPKMSGAQCFGRLKEINSNVRVIIATGYGDNSERDALKKEGVEMFIQKPYKAAELCKKIEALMADAP